MKKQVIGLSYYSKLLALFCIATSATIISTSCTNNAGGSPNTQVLQKKNMQLNLEKKSNNILTQPIEPNLDMGEAFDSRTGMPKGLSCLVNHYDPSAVQITGEYAEINLDRPIDADALANTLNIKLSGPDSFGQFSSSYNAYLVRSIVNTRESLHFTYKQSRYADIKFNIKALGNDALATAARKILEESSDQSQFYTACGDSFLQSAEIGALLVIDLNLEFATASDKNEFQSHLKTTGLNLASIQAAFKLTNPKVAENAYLTISVWQLGGDNSSFIEIFGKGSGGYSTQRCSASNLTECSGTLNKVIEYSQQYFTGSVDLKKPDNLILFRPNIKKYHDIGINAALPPLPDEEQNAREYLVNSISHDRMIKKYLEQYLRQPIISFLNPIKMIEINKTIKEYDNIIKYYNNLQIVDACYGDTIHLSQRCIDAANQIKSIHDSNYRIAIESATYMADTIVVKEDYGYHALVPLDGFCNLKGECQGKYAVYTSSRDDNNNIHTDFKNETCIVDTTVDNSYFKTEYPEYVGKIYICNKPNDHGVDTLSSYLKRKGIDASVGIWGQYINEIEYDDPVDQTGINTRLNYSGSNLDYNPI